MILGRGDGSKGVAQAMHKTDAVGFEQLAQQLFQAIITQDLVQNIEVKHNVRLEGILTSHQVDVFWEFRVGDVRYQTVVEVKDWAKPVDQGEILEFKAVLNDLPGQPRGIVVSQSGFQAGARRIAAIDGIVLYELRKPTASDLKNRVSSLILNLSTHFLRASDVHLEHDENWRLSEARRLGLTEAPRLRLRLDASELRLLSEDGGETRTIQNVLDDLYPARVKELAPIRMRHEFAHQTFLDTGTPSFPRLKLVALEATICSSKVDQEIGLDVNEFVQYILKETLTGAVQTFDHKLQRRLSD
jgi:hypothetical protein